MGAHQPLKSLSDMHRTIPAIAPSTRRAAAWSLLAAGTAALMLTTLPARAAGDAAAGQAKAAVCGACHGPDGNSTNPEWPKLAGQHAAYLELALKAYKSGARKNPLMSPQAAALSDQDMADLAAYYAAQKAR
jgi:cytochrome c553